MLCAPPRYVTPFLFRSILAATLFLGTASALRADDILLHPSGLRCEYLTDPLGLGETAPRLSWIGESARRAESQSAYQVLVAATPTRSPTTRATSGTAARSNPPKARTSPTPASRSSPAPPVSGRCRSGTATAAPPPGARPRAGPWACSPGRTGRRNGSTPPEQIPPTIPSRSWSQQAAYAGHGRPAAATMSPPFSRVRRRKIAAISWSKTTRSAATRPRSPQEIERRVHAWTARRPPPVRRGRRSCCGRSADRAACAGPSQVNSPWLHASGHALRHRAGPLRSASQRPARRRPRARAGVDRLQPARPLPGVRRHLAPAHRRQRPRRAARQRLVRRAPRQRRLPAIRQTSRAARATGNHLRGRHDANASSPTTPGRPTPARCSRAISCSAKTTTPARNSPAGTRPGFDDRDWSAATVRDEKPRALDAQVAPPVRADRRTQAHRAHRARARPLDLRPRPEHGRRRAPEGRRPRRARSVTLRHAEMLNPDGTIYTTNLRGAPSMDTYICKGGGEETWQPRFTFHGFRYVELTGLPDKPAADAVTGIVLGTDTPRAGKFACSDPRINQLQSNIEWGQRGNYLSVPTDCPQRDERLGWMGDAEVFVRTATDKADVAAFFTKWLVDVDDAQTPDGAFTDVSPEHGAGAGTPGLGRCGRHLPVDDLRGLRRPAHPRTPSARHDEMGRMVPRAQHRSDPRQGPRRRLRRLALHRRGHAQGPDRHRLFRLLHASRRQQPTRPSATRRTPAKYEKLFEDISAAFNRAYVAPDGRIKGNTQCGYAMALKFELLPEDAARRRRRNILADDIDAKGNHLSTGFRGRQLPAAGADGRAAGSTPPTRCSCRTRFPRGCSRSSRARRRSGSAGTAGRPTRASRPRA